MAAGFKWWNYLGSDFLDHEPHVAAAAVGVGVLAVGTLAYRMRAPLLNSQVQNDEAFIPPKNLGIRNIMELTGSFVQTTSRDVIGDHYPRYLPLMIFVFLWTLVNNLLGIFPGFGSATDNLNTTLAMGLVVFFYYNIEGFRAHGFKYLEHFTGHLHGALLLLLGPVLFVIETISHMVRPATLGIRLRTNIYADHMIFGEISALLASLTGAIQSVAGEVIGGIAGGFLQLLAPIPILALGVLISLLQAFVFMLLTMIYIGMATAHEDH